MCAFGLKSEKSADFHENLRKQHFSLQNAKSAPKPSIFLVLEQHFRKGREKSEKVLFLVIFMKIRTFLTFGPKSAHFGEILDFLTFWSKSEEIAKNMKPWVLPPKNLVKHKPKSTLAF